MICLGILPCNANKKSTGDNSETTTPVLIRKKQDHLVLRVSPWHWIVQAGTPVALPAAFCFCPDPQKARRESERFLRESGCVCEGSAVFLTCAVAGDPSLYCMLHYKDLRNAKPAYLCSNDDKILSQR